MNRVETFWTKYIKADEIERRELCLTLIGMDKLNVSLMQSYFDDLIEFMEKKEK